MTARHVLSFPMEEGRFNYRVAGIIVADGHVLICREDDDDYAMLPGGRVELGEDSLLSLTREIAEEIALPAEVGAMFATSESFYRREGEDFHELGFFYAVTLPGQGPNGKSPWLMRRDEGHDLQFHWVPLEGRALEEFNLLPRWLPDFLRNLPKGHAHIVFDERTGGVSAPGDAIATTLKLGRPAHRALAAAGIVTFADLAHWTRQDVAALHGIGPRSFTELDPAMAARGLSYKT